MIILYITFWQALKKTIGAMVFLLLVCLYISIPITIAITTENLPEYKILSFISIIFYVLFTSIYMFGGSCNRFDRILDFLLGD